MKFRLLVVSLLCQFFSSHCDLTIRLAKMIWDESIKLRLVTAEYTLSDCLDILSTVALLRML